MKRKAIPNYSTAIAPMTTVGQIMGMLAAHGAKGLQVHMDRGQVLGVDFALDTAYGTRAFRLPVNVEGAYRALQAAYEERRINRAYSSREHAARVAWRIAKDWLDSQLALIEMEMATLVEVLLPYMLVEHDKTLYQRLSEGYNLLLPAPEGNDG